MLTLNNEIGFFCSAKYKSFFLWRLNDFFSGILLSWSRLIHVCKKFSVIIVDFCEIMDLGLMNVLL